MYEHGSAVFTLNRAGIALANIAPELSPTDVFPGELSFKTQTSLTPRDFVVPAARLAYLERVAGLGVKIPDDPLAPAAVVIACCEHVREQHARQAGILTPTLAAAFAELPDWWLIVTIAPGTPPTSTDTESPT